MFELGYVSSVWSNGGMILADGSTCTGRETCHSASSSTKNPTLIGRGSNPGLRGERAVIAAFGVARPCLSVCLSVVALLQHLQSLC